MLSPSPLHAHDPVSQAVSSSARTQGRFPVPLVATSYDITICGGLADVVAKRRFHNGETLSIEAAVTFPLPVHAVLYALEAKIGDRTVKAIAKSRTLARAAYEDAIDRGKTTVLHEELLKGVHLLSVGHVPPGTDIEVTARFAIALSLIGGKALLRIPTTVGDIYGASGLADCDELQHGGTLLAGEVRIACDSGAPELLGGKLVNGAARVWLDSPIVVEVQDWKPRTLAGNAADGRAVKLAIEPGPAADADLDAAILVDRSGSMNERAAITAQLSKHAAVLLGLSEAAGDLRPSDRLNLWEFDTSANDLGTANAGTWRALIHRLSPPGGGTEIGHSIEVLLAQRPVRDVILVTDGKSHALDVQGLALRGVRFTVVLIGEDSLEANVGYLASLTGGEIFVPAGADVSAAVSSALRSLRFARAIESEAPVLPAGSVRAHRAGMAILAAWSSPSSIEGPLARAVGAYAASLRLPKLSQAEAAALAEQEGLVTHLTSLVLVDEAGASHAGLPAMRKVALPSPATGHVVAAHCAPVVRCAAPAHVEYSRDLSRAPPAVAMGRPPKLQRAIDSTSFTRLKKVASEVLGRAQSPSRPPEAEETDATHIKSLAHLVGRIDWQEEGQRLAEGNMIGLAGAIADAIDQAAGYGAVKRLAKRLGIKPRVLVIALLARASAGRDRHADRVARAILAKAKSKDIAPLAARLGL